MNVLMGLLLCYELNIFLLMTKQSSLSLSDTSDTTLTVHACFVVGIQGRLQEERKESFQEFIQAFSF